MAFYASGTGQPVGELAKKASVEFVVSVNERIDLLRQMPGRGSAGTYANGANDWATGNSPVYADLVGKPLHAWRDDCLAQIRTAIESIAPYFAKVHTTSPPLITLYTDIADLLGAGSFGASWVTPVRVQTANAYLQVREALENLTWVSGVCAKGSPLGRFHSLTNGTTAQGAWDNSLLAAVNSNFGTQYINHRMIVNAPSDYDAGVAVSHKYPVVFPASWPAFAGLFVYTDFFYRQTNNAFVPKTSESAACNLGPSTLLDTWVVAPSYTAANVLLDAPLPTGTQDLMFTWEPALHPWTSIAGSGNDHLHFGSLVIEPVKSAANIAAELTYG